MTAKAVLFVCAQALVLQSIAGQCIGAGWAGAPLAAAPFGIATGCGAPLGIAAGCGAPWGAPFGAGIYAADALAPAAAAASHGGALPIASASAIPPSGVSVASENAYCGDLAVRGALPFLGTVSLEGALPTAGAGAVAFGCGNGAVAILTEDIGAAGIAGPLAIDAGIGPLGYGIGPLGYDAPLVGPFGRAGCGCGRGVLI